MSEKEKLMYDTIEKLGGVIVTMGKALITDKWLYGVCNKAAENRITEMLIITADCLSKALEIFIDYKEEIEKE